MSRSWTQLRSRNSSSAWNQFRRKRNARRGKADQATLHFIKSQKSHQPVRFLLRNLSTRMHTRLRLFSKMIDSWIYWRKRLRLRDCSPRMESMQMVCLRSQDWSKTQIRNQAQATTREGRRTRTTMKIMWAVWRVVGSNSCLVFWWENSPQRHQVGRRPVRSRRISYQSSDQGVTMCLITMHLVSRQWTHRTTLCRRWTPGCQTRKIRGSIETMRTLHGFKWVWRSMQRWVAWGNSWYQGLTPKFHPENRGKTRMDKRMMIR